MTQKPNIATKVSDAIGHLLFCPDLEDVRMLHHEALMNDTPFSPKEKRVNYIRHAIARYGGLLAVSAGLYLADNTPRTSYVTDPRTGEVRQASVPSESAGFALAMGGLTLLATSVIDTYQKRRKLEESRQNSRSL